MFDVEFSLGGCSAFECVIFLCICAAFRSSVEYALSEFVVGCICGCRRAKVRVVSVTVTLENQGGKGGEEIFGEFDTIRMPFRHQMGDLSQLGFFVQVLMSPVSSVQNA